MSQLNRKALKRLILKEFKMMGMAPMGGGMIGGSPYEVEVHHDHEDYVDHVPGGHLSAVGHSHSHGGVSKEDCCKAVLCLIECCECEDTKAKIRQCCEEILGSC